MSRIYYQAMPQLGPNRPDTALPLAGGACWFTHLACLSRGAAPRIIAAAEAPMEVLARLTDPRLPVAGMAMDRPQLMGILNITPDSFSDGGQFLEPQAALAQARQLAEDGADILDLGGESTRPGADFVPAEEETRRTAPVISALRTAGLPTPISIDTRKAAVGRAALEAGADMLNDVSAMSFDAEMAALAAKTGAPICLMHAQGDPKTMQADPSYDDVLLDVYDYLENQIATAEAAGIARDKIIVDPGIGFGKSLAHNLQLLRGLSLFHSLGCPILLGVSRKRFIGTIGGEAQADQREPGSIAVALDAVRQGVQLIRAHDIKSHRQALSLWQASIAGTWKG